MQSTLGMAETNIEATTPASTGSHPDSEADIFNEQASSSLWGAAAGAISSFLPAPVRMALEAAPGVANGVEHAGDGCRVG